MSELHDSALEIVRGIGDILRDAATKPRQVESKSTSIDLVTETDRRAEAYAFGVIEKRYPDHARLGEEGGASGKTDGPIRWIVDPLDGTVNFVHGIPHFSALLAVQERRGEHYETVHGLVFDPMRDELYEARLGEGATLNEQPIRVSGVKRIRESLNATGFSYDRLSRDDDNHREFCRVNLVSQGARRFGSAGLDLAYVACGRYDFMWEYRLNAWDVAAGDLLVREAGGRMSDLEGAPLDLFTGNTLASNSHLHDEVLRALASARDLPINSKDGVEEFVA